MKILITGAKGFVGKNLCAQLDNIATGKARWYKVPAEGLQVFQYDIDSKPEDLEQYCKEADFVFNLAGVNRPKDPEEFMKGNFGFATTLLNTLKKYKNTENHMASIAKFGVGAIDVIIEDRRQK